MKRLNNTELETRINNFLTRKFAEFPELEEAEPTVTTGRTANARSQPKVRQLEPKFRWGTVV